MKRTYERRILSLAVPAAGALLADPLVSLVDTAFVGRLGTVSLAALGVNTAIFTLAFYAFNFLAYGVTPLVSESLGADNESQAIRIIASGLIAAVGLGVGIMVVLEAFTVPLLSLMGAGGDLLNEAAGYLRIRALASPAVLIITLGHGGFRGYQNTRSPLVVALGLNLVNLILDPILIYGLGWGLNGAAVATVVAQWTGALWFLGLMRGRLGLKFRGVARADMRTLLRVGRDATIRASALLVAFAAAARVAAGLGDTQIAAHQVAIQLLFFLALAVDGLKIAAQSLIARFVGEGRESDARAISIELLWMGAIAGVGLSLLLVVGQSVVPGWFSTDSEVTEAIEGIWPILTLMLLVAAPIYVLEGIVMGASDFRYLAIAMVASMAATLAAFLAVVYFGWGLTGVWWSLIGGLNFVRGITLGWWFFKLDSRFRPHLTNFG